MICLSTLHLKSLRTPSVNNDLYQTFDRILFELDLYQTYKFI